MTFVVINARKVSPKEARNSILTQEFLGLNSVLCWSADAQHLAAYRHYDFYENTLLPVTLKITIAWGWLMFAINTTLTGAIIGKILYVS